jgi:BirA family transcriptional regulator, biotin operon repressor / biotin---[acetyl-CoA-carboxylase] ligase
MFDLTALAQELAETIYADQLHFSPVTGSTNSDAMSAARTGAPHGSVYFADEQTAGRGRGDHAWHSAAGVGLYVSVLLRPELSPAFLPLVPLAAGLAAADAIRSSTGLEIDLRWPNDLLIGVRKAGGILVEAQSESNAVAFVVVGIGINVHQRDFEPGLATPATSLDLELGHVFGQRTSRQTLLVRLLESLERESRGLLDGTGRASIPGRVEAASSWVRGRTVEVHGPQQYTGTTEGLDEHGFLLVRTASGVVQVQTGGIRAASSF